MSKKYRCVWKGICGHCLYHNTIVQEAHMEFEYKDVPINDQQNTQELYCLFCFYKFTAQVSKVRRVL